MSMPWFGVDSSITKMQTTSYVANGFFALVLQTAYENGSFLALALGETRHGNIKT
jgi:hypothetical protein